MTGDTFDKFQPPDRGRVGDNELAPTPAARGPRVTGPLAREKGLL